MLDLHTHILPGMDDGSRDVPETMALLAREKEQGIHTVVFTPHFYASRETPERFLKRRAAALERMEAADEYPQNRPERVYLGAEVAYFEGISRMEKPERLCIGDTGAMLVEMPFCRWNDRMLNNLFMLRNACGIQPILAHIERFLQYQPRGIVQELCEGGIWIQSNASFFLHWQTRGKAMRMLDQGLIHFLGSDCHDTKQRIPNLRQAVTAITRKLSDDVLIYLQEMEHKLFEDYQEGGAG